MISKTNKKKANEMELEQVDNFKNLGQIISQNGKSGQEIMKRLN